MDGWMNGYLNRAASTCRLTTERIAWVDADYRRLYRTSRPCTTFLCISSMQPLSQRQSSDRDHDPPPAAKLGELRALHATLLVEIHVGAFEH